MNRNIINKKNASYKAKRTVDILLIFLCIGFMFFMMLAIGARFFAKEILAKKYNCDNFLTRIILFDDNVSETDNDFLYEDDEEKSNNSTTSENAQSDGEQKENTGILKLADKFKKKIDGCKSTIEEYSTKHLPGYSLLTSCSKSYENCIKWNFTTFTEYNNFIKIGDNYFCQQVEPRDVTDSAAKTIDFSAYCEERDIDFLYVQMPSKISKYDDTGLSGTIDFSNQNADSFMEMLKNADVNCFDLREEINNENFTYRDLFYETDHHWKAETGLWASGEILKKIKNFGYNINPDVSAKENFDFVVYKDWFLGSQGKKATLAQATPEDISLIYPKAETLFHYEIPSIGIDVTGDFSVTYEMSYVSEKNYMHSNPYAAYNHADQALIKIENQLADNDCRVLIIHNSYANCVIPFMALGVKNIDAIDLREYKDSVKSYIEETNPDVVIVTYPCNTLGAIDTASNTDMFNFE